MKIRICDWAGAAKKKMDELGLHHNQERELTELEFWTVVQRVLDAGLEVLLAKQIDGSMFFGIDETGGKFQ